LQFPSDAIERRREAPLVAEVVSGRGEVLRDFCARSADPVAHMTGKAIALEDEVARRCFRFVRSEGFFALLQGRADGSSLVLRE
jgi:hypothetical protein